MIINAQNQKQSGDLNYHNVSWGRIGFHNVKSQQYVAKSGNVVWLDIWPGLITATFDEILSQ